MIILVFCKFENRIKHNPIYRRIKCLIIQLSKPECITFAKTVMLGIILKEGILDQVHRQERNFVLDVKNFKNRASVFPALRFLRGKAKELHGLSLI